MSKYILHGGGLRTSADEGKAFFSDMAEGLGAKLNVLMCFFAQPQEAWQDKYAEWRVRTAACIPRVTIHFGLATQSEFQEQCKHFDTLFVYGGSSRKLINEIKQIKNHGELLAGFKAVAGTSAGAIMLSQYGWDCDERKIEEGLNFVPAKVLVHYESKTYGADDPRGPVDWQKAKRELGDYGNPLVPVFELPEGRFESFEA